MQINMKQNSEKKNFLHKADRQHITAVGGDLPVSGGVEKYIESKNMKSKQKQTVKAIV